MHKPPELPNNVMEHNNGSFMDAINTQQPTPRYSVQTVNGLPKTFCFTFFKQPDGILAIGEYDHTDIESLRKELIKLNNEVNNSNRIISKQNAELSRLNALKNRVIGMLAHDIRNPMTVITMYVSNVLEGATETLKPKHKRALGKVLNVSLFIRKLTNDLLDVSKIESGTMELDRQRINLVNVVRQNVALNADLAAGRDIHIEFKSNTDTLELDADPQKIEQVLNNLIHNSIKYSETGSSIFVRCEQDGSFARIAVTDQGTGIAPELIKHIFEPYHTGGTGDGVQEKRAGLGLYIVKCIIKAHGGTIDVQSQPAKGTTMTARFPILKTGDPHDEK
jgi:signal transduction histidine kinase